LRKILQYDQKKDHSYINPILSTSPFMVLSNPIHCNIVDKLQKILSYKNLKCAL